MGCSPGVKMKKKAVTSWHQGEADLPLRGPSGSEGCLTGAAGLLGPSGARGTNTDACCPL